GTAVAVADAVANRGDTHEVRRGRKHDVRARDAGRAVGRADGGDRQRVAVHVTVVNQRRDGDADVFHRVGDVIQRNRRIVGRGHRDADQRAGGTTVAVADAV